MFKKIILISGFCLIFFLNIHPAQAALANKHVSGTVLYPNKSPVVGALVYIYPLTNSSLQPVETTTDNFGNYQFDVAGDKWMINIEPDYNNNDVSKNWVYFEPARKISFVENNSYESLEIDFIVAKTNATISGTVLNYDQSVPQSAYVQVIDKDHNSLTGAINIQTGQFSIPVIAGLLKVKVVSTDSSNDPFAVSKIIVKSGETYNLGTISGLARAAIIKGQVVSKKNNTALVNRSVFIWDDVNNNYYTTETDANGSFSFPVYKATWVVSAPSDSAYQILNNLNITISKNKDISDNNVLYLEPRSVSIKGNLIDEVGDTISIDNFIPYAISSTGETYTGNITSGSSYEIKVPVSETYEVYLYFNPDSEYLLKAKTSIAISNTTVDNVNMTVMADSSTIHGKLIDNDGKTITGLRARVLATSKYGVRTTEVDEATGVYELAVPAGDWLVNYELISDSSEYLSQYEEVEKVSVLANDDSLYNLSLVKTPYTISGKVKDVNGRVLPFSEVYLVNSDHKLYATANKYGIFSIKAPKGKYEIGCGKHLSSSNVAPSSQEVNVAGDVKNLNLTFVKGDKVLSGKVNKSKGFVRAYSNNGHFYSAEIINNQYSLTVKDGETLNIEAVSINSGKLYRNIPESVAINGNTTFNLVLEEDPAVVMPVADLVNFQGQTSQILNLSKNALIQIPAYAIADDDINLIFGPTLKINSHDYSAPIDIGYEFIAQPVTGLQYPKIKYPITAILNWDYRGLAALKLKESNLTVNRSEDNSGLLENTGVAVFDKTNNRSVIISDHLDKIALTSAKNKYFKLLQSSDLSIINQQNSSLILKWRKIFGAKKYYVHYKIKNDENWQKKTVKKTQINISDLSNHSVYYFKVKAIRDNRSSAWSKILKKTINY